MKQETKELIDWIKKQINIAKTNNIDPAWNGKHEAYNADYQKAMAFLDSLPEIEARLTRGGYVQDGFEKPCCNGDRIKDKVGEGVLYWSKYDFRFYIKRKDGNPDLIQGPFIKAEL